MVKILKKLRLLKSVSIPKINLEFEDNSKFVKQAECALDSFSYSDPFSDSRWSCRVCNNKNFPKEAVCRRCKTKNHLILLRKTNLG